MILGLVIPRVCAVQLRESSLNDMVGLPSRVVSWLAFYVMGKYVLAALLLSKG